MNNEAKKKCANLFAAEFAQCLGDSLAEATGTQWPLQVMETTDAAANGATQIHFRLTVEGGISGECFAEFYESQAAELVAKAVSRQGADSEPQQPADALETFLISAMENLSRCMTPKFGALTVKVEKVAGLAFGGMFVVPLAMTHETAKLQALLYFSDALLEGLSLAESGSGSEARPSTVLPKNLKLVMAVELSVSLRFGHRQMPLREVLELASGSVIELDRLVDEPVELLLDGKLIARGEAVVVDGNYGLRVTEIPQPVTTHFLN
jgi:flagellar motor switch protein FliN/FliY